MTTSKKMIEQCPSGDWCETGVLCSCALHLDRKTYEYNFYRKGHFLECECGEIGFAEDIGKFNKESGELEGVICGICDREQNPELFSDEEEEVDRFEPDILET